MFYVTYIDDILVYLRTLREYKEHVAKVLNSLAQADLRIDPKKLVFYTNSVEFLGFIITTEGIEIDTTKVDSILT